MPDPGEGVAPDGTIRTGALADDGIVAAVVTRFGSLIGFWADDHDGR